MLSTERTLETLQRGLSQVRELWEASDRSHRRIEGLLDLADQVTWAVSNDGLSWSYAAGSKGDTEIRVVVLKNNPAPGTALHPAASFQTWPEMWGDAAPTVYVRRFGFTTLWAGLVLCHELDHALEYVEGKSAPGEPQAAWDSAESRAHTREAGLLDAITGGALVDAVAGFNLADVLARRPEELASELSLTIPVRLRTPPRSEPEMLHRRGGLIMSAAMIAAAAPERITRDTFDTDLGDAYRRATKAWNYGQR